MRDRFIAHRNILFAALSLLLVAPALAQRYDAYSLADSVTIGERFEILVSVEHDGDRSPLFPHDFLRHSLSAGTAFELGGFTVLGNTPVARRRISSGWVIDSLRYEVATFELDSAYVPTMPIGLVAAADTLVADTPPVIVWVKSLVPDDAEGIRDITGLAEFPGTSWIWYLLPAALLAALAYWYWKRRQRGEEVEEIEQAVVPTEPPWEQAQRRLQLLEQMDLSNPDNIKPFFIELSELLRTYLARRTHVPALESTTNELIQKLKLALDRGVVPVDILAEVEGVLCHADLVKFADMHPVSDEGRSALYRTRTAILETEKEFNARQEARREALTKEQKTLGTRATEVETAPAAEIATETDEDIA